VYDFLFACTGIWSLSAISLFNADFLFAFVLLYSQEFFCIFCVWAIMLLDIDGQVHVRVNREDICDRCCCNEWSNCSAIALSSGCEQRCAWLLCRMCAAVLLNCAVNNLKLTGNSTTIGPFVYSRHLSHILLYSPEHEPDHQCP